MKIMMVMIIVSVTLPLLLSVLSVFSAQGDRNITITNNCNEVVRVGRTGASCIRANETTTGHCPPSTTINPLDKVCYWDLPSPNGGPWQTQDLQPDQSITLTLSHPDQHCVDPTTGTAVTIQWSGTIWGATGCDRGHRVCETAICFNGDVSQNGQCPTYMGPVGPVTRAEFTLQSNATDFYDITSIDGVNLPIEMKPSTQDVLSASTAGLTGTKAAYWCGNPGGVMSTSPVLSGCSWSYNPTFIPNFGDQLVHLTLVAPSTDPNDPNNNCTNDSDCPQGQVCGTLQQLNPTSGGPMPGLFPGRCGRFIGFWNSNGICTWAQGVTNPTTFPNNTPFNCKTNAGSGPGTFEELYGCSGEFGVSGYLKICRQMPQNMVCGCPNWKSKGINAPNTIPCLCKNPEWQENAVPWIQWMKKACPTTFAFQFDDSSSQFQCSNQDGNTDNTLGYNITFCPGGVSITRKVNLFTNSAGGNGCIRISRGRTEF